MPQPHVDCTLKWTAARWQRRQAKPPPLNLCKRWILGPGVRAKTSVVCYVVCVNVFSRDSSVQRDVTVMGSRSWRARAPAPVEVRVVWDGWDRWCALYPQRLGRSPPCRSSARCWDASRRERLGFWVPSCSAGRERTARWGENRRSRSLSELPRDGSC